MLLNVFFGCGGMFHCKTTYQKKLYFISIRHSRAQSCTMTYHNTYFLHMSRLPTPDSHYLLLAGKSSDVQRCCRTIITLARRIQPRQCPLANMLCQNWFFWHLVLVHFNQFQVENLLNGIITIDFPPAVTRACDKDNSVGGLKPH